VALRRARGFNLPELMISLAIGSLLLAAFLSILDRARREFTANESLAQLQDGARQALAVLVPDLEHAGFYGFASPTSAQLTRGGNVVAGSVELRQPFLEPVPPARGLPAGAHDCGVNFAVDLVQAVQGANNSFPPGIEARDCAATASAGGVRAGTDSLTVRRASLAATRPRAGRLQLYARRLESHGPLTLFADGHAPGPLDEGAEVRDIEVRTYYIANHSIGRPGWPALRLKALTESRGVPQFRDEEIQPGIEDLQVEFGVRTGENGPRIRYVPPDAREAREGRVVAVRLWLRIRAEITERGFADTRALDYAGVHFTPDARESAQRRLLVERTVALRNSSAR
jgi:type IV pilus assembly protein PilW